MQMGNSRPEPDHHDDKDQDDTVPRTAQGPWCGRNLVKSVVVFAGFLLFSSVLTSDPSKNENIRIVGDFKPLKKDDQGKNQSRSVQLQLDKFLGGLIAEGFDEKSCLSRYQSFWNHKRKQTHRPSSHLISKLRDYEALHQRCGPHSNSFKKAIQHLNSRSANSSNSSTDCKYVVWVARDGLGNRMITLVSAFLYAILTKRVLLADSRTHISDLFCEPFPRSSWLIPFSSPQIIKSFNKDSPKSYGYMLKWKKLQSMPSFQEELHNLFPEKETVFQFLGRYLFHPTNSIWKSISNYYNDHLARADEKMGIQIRIFKTNPDPFDQVLHQILACVIKEKDLLPQLNSKNREPGTNISGKLNMTKAVLMTSLDSRYYDVIQKMYIEGLTLTNEIIQVYQPSSERKKKSSNKVHNMKAWEEMYLLSLTDKLVTSSKSTFGYVAQSLGGMKPWILYRPEEYNASNSKPACQRPCPWNRVSRLRQR